MSDSVTVVSLCKPIAEFDFKPVRSKSISVVNNSLLESFWIFVIAKAY